MISVEVRMHGNLRRFLPQGVGSIRLEVPDGTRIGELVERLRADNEVGVAAIGNRAVALSAALEDGVSIDFYPHLEGG